MSDYVYNNGYFIGKDTLPPGNAAKVIIGADFETEFVNIEAAVNSKMDSTSPVMVGTLSGGTIDGGTF